MLTCRQGKQNDYRGTSRLCQCDSPAHRLIPSCTRCREVETLFHEFGHACQHMLTAEKEGLVSGIRGVEWDAVELPSQFMENW